MDTDSDEEIEREQENGGQKKKRSCSMVKEGFERIASAPQVDERRTVSQCDDSEPVVPNPLRRRVGLRTRSRTGSLIRIRICCAGADVVWPFRTMYYALPMRWAFNSLRRVLPGAAQPVPRPQPSEAKRNEAVRKA